MAEVSYLQLHENDDEHDDRDEVVVSFNPLNNCSQDLDAFDWPSTHDFFCHTDPNHSILFDRENQVNFVIDMFHQSVEQSQSRVSDLRNPDRNEGTDAIDLGVLGLGLGFSVGVNNDRNNGDDDNPGFMFSDCWDDFFMSRTDPSNGPEYFAGGFTVPDLGSDSDFQPEHGPNSNANFNHILPNANEDLEWEEIDDHESVRDEQPNDLEWEVLLNNHNLESNPDLADYNYTEHEMLFGQFLETDSSSSGRPPASRTVVENLSSVKITDEDFETVCAVCKDEIGVGLTAKQLPCGHLYHGDCILPWLGIRNTCPVCRYELLTDDVDYERRKAERGAAAGV